MTSSLRLAGLVAALACAAPLSAQEAAPPAAAPPTDAETLAWLNDATRRMTVPVEIDGRGPYQFIVDTGSERTVISRELAHDLGLAPGRAALVHSMTEVSHIPTVVIPMMEVGARRTMDIHAPALPQLNLGAAGMLGSDGLQSQQVEFDFIRRQMTVSSARRRVHRASEDEIVITARSRLGRLVLVDASVDGQRVHAIVDTGAEYTIANEALRRQLQRRGRLGEVRTVELISVTGGRFNADYTIARRLRIGGIDIERLPIAFAAVHIFRQLDLEDRPAILLGMDALRLFDRVAVDFANRRVRFLVPTSRPDPNSRLAALEAIPERPAALPTAESRSPGSGPSRP
jgi:predicted aspartyl protease